ncbi:MAG: DUF362 domain-containing protein [Candidatus Thermoplasmatota archaeon]
MVVFLEKGEEGFETTLKAIEKAELRKYIPDDRNVLIKPNLVTSAGSDEGITTDVKVVEAVIHYLKENGIKNMVVGEGSGNNTYRSFERNGYSKLKEKYNVEILDLNKDNGITSDVKNPISINRIKVAELAYNSFRISVAKLKIHSIGVITGTIKNMMGCLPGRNWKILIHSDIQNRLIDLAKVIMPDFGIIDGIVGNEVDEVVPRPVRMNIIIAGKDCVSVDSVSAEAMGVKWNEVPYLVLAEKEGLGIANTSKIEIKGAKVEEVKKKFNRSKTLWSTIRTGTEIVYGKVIERVGIE